MQGRLASIESVWGKKIELDMSEVVFVDLYLFSFCFYQKAETAYPMDSHNTV